MAFRPDIIAGRAVILVNIEDTVDKQLRGVRTKLRRFSNSVGEIGGDLFRGGSAGLIGAIFPVKEFMDFQDQLLFIQTKLQATDHEMMGLEQTIRNLGKSTSFTSKEVGQAAQRLAQAGFTIDEVTSSLQASLDLGRGGQVDLSTATDILANTIRAYGLEAKDADLVASKFITAARLGTLDIVDLNEALKNAATTFRLLNMDLDTSLALITKLSTASLRGTIAGTSLNRAFQKLATENKKLQNLGITLDEEDFRNPVQILGKLEEITRNLSAPEAVGVLNDLLGIRGGRGLGGILIQGIGPLDETLKEIKGSLDEARISAEKLDSRLGGVFRRAKSAFQEFLLAAGGTSEGPLTKFGESTRVFFNNLSELSSKNPKLLQTLFLLPPVALAAGTAFLGLAYALNKLASAMTPLISLNRLVVGGIAGLFGTSLKSGIGIVKSLFKNLGKLLTLNSKKISKGFIGFLKKPGTGTLKVLGSFLALFKALRRFVFSMPGFLLIIEGLLLVGNKIPPVAAVLDRTGVILKETFKDVLEVLRATVPALQTIKEGVFTLFQGDIVGGFGLFGEGLKDLLDILKNGLYAAWLRLEIKIAPVLDKIKEVAFGLREVVYQLFRVGGIVIGTGATAVGKGLYSLTPQGASNTFSSKNINALFAGVIEGIRVIGVQLVKLVGIIAVIGDSVKKAVVAILRTLGVMPGYTGAAARKELNSLDANAPARDRINAQIRAIQAAGAEDQLYWPTVEEEMAWEKRHRDRKMRIDILKQALKGLDPFFQPVSYDVEKAIGELDKLKDVFKGIPNFYTGLPDPMTLMTQNVPRGANPFYPEQYSEQKYRNLLEDIDKKNEQRRLKNLAMKAKSNLLTELRPLAEAMKKSFASMIPSLASALDTAKSTPQQQRLDDTLNKLASVTGSFAQTRGQLIKLATRNEELQALNKIEENTRPENNELNFSR